MNKGTNKHMEILAPAGAWQQMEAAVRSGADAVYLGTRALNARMRADNFDDLKATVSYCHVRNVKVYVTVNTLIREDELPLLRDTLRLVAESGADAVLATDMATVGLVRSACPGLPLHASTQMTVHNLSGAHLMRDLGFSRVVLAREMSRDEIAHVTAHAGIETEVFVHGALCMSVSGQCLMSSFLGQRSGNRGRCAQPCRLDFHTDKDRYVLSLKDLSLCEHLRELEDMGVASAKIEGRLKRPEYVAAAVRACTGYREGREPDMEELADVFSRSGFTQGHYLGKRDRSMFGIRDTSGEDNTARLSAIRERYRTERQSVPLTFDVRNGNGKILITADDGARKCGRTLSEDPSLETPLKEDRAEGSLRKLGGTPYLAASVTIDAPGGLRCRAGDINRAKKELTEEMTALRAVTVPHAFTKPADIKRPAATPAGKPLIYLFLSDMEQWDEETMADAGRVYLPLEQLDEGSVRSHPGIGARLFPFAFGKEDDRTFEKLLRLKDCGLSRVSAGNPGGLFQARRAGLECFGEYTLGIMNTSAADMYRSLGVAEHDLSVEWNLRYAPQMGYAPDEGLLVYGKIPLMSFRACPLTSTGCRACGGHGQIMDRYDTPFELMCHARQISQLLNPHPLYWGDMKDRLPPLHHHSFLFTLESREECREILRAYRAGEALPGTVTRGLYNKELL